jgi:hypothetical protein
VDRHREPGWIDDDELAKLAPRDSHSCAAVPFVPGRAAFLAVVRGGDEYVEAMAAAAKWRSRGVSAQIVLSRDFAALVQGRDGFWLVLDADDDVARLRERLPHGARVISGRLADGLPVTNLRALGEYAAAYGQFSPFGAKDVVATRAGVYLGFASSIYYLPLLAKATENSSGVLDAGAGPAWQAAGCKMVAAAPTSQAPRGRLAVLEIDVQPLAGAAITRVALHGDDAFLLDSQGRWFKLDGCQLHPTSALEPPPKNDEVVEVSGWRYRVEEGPGPSTAWLRGYRGGKLGFSIPFSQGSGLWSIHGGAGRLVLVSSDELRLFEVDPELLPPRLVRVCGRYNQPTPRRGRRTGHVTFAGIVATADRAGNFDLWTSAWGDLKVDYRPPILHDACDKHEQGLALAGGVSLFDQPEEIVEYGLYCNPNED